MFKARVALMLVISMLIAGSAGAQPWQAVDPATWLVIERAAMPAFGTALIIERIALGICLEARRVRCAATHSTTLADNPEFTIRARLVP